jgi:MFS family permease
VSITMSQQMMAMDDAVRHLVTNHNPKGNRVGWLMLASILVEAWDLYSIGFVLIFIRDQYHPDPLLLGLAAGGTQAGALIGAQLGGILSDKIGRRLMFLTTMVLFIVLAVTQSFVTSVGWLVVVRFVLGIPLGSDITTGYAYIMESMPKGDREVMGNRWQFVFASGNVLAVAVVTLFLIYGMSHEWIWRVTLGLGALPAFIILVMRRDLPETAIWLIRQGRFRDAKKASIELFDDPLEMLPDADVMIKAPATSAFLADIRRDPIRWRATLYGWISGFCQAAQFQTFGFYLPVLFAMVGVSSNLGNNLILICLYLIAAASGWIAPMITSKVGQRGIGMLGFGAVLVALLTAAGALYTGNVFILPFSTALMMCGQYCAASSGMTIPTMVAKTEYRGTASGFSYMFVKLAAFLSIFLFPSVFTAIGQANSTLLVSIFALVGLLAATFLLPEVYGFERD